MDKKIDKNLINNITVIIREANERTLPLCRELIESEVGSDKMFVVSEAPFTKALKKTYEVAIERGSPWTLVIDADVLVRKGAIEYLLRVAQCLDSNVFKIHGKVIDKLAGGTRAAGIHLYRTAYLHKAITIIPPEKAVARPEGHTAKQMKSQGFPFLEPDLVVGLHDYEQYFRDVYRKAFFHAHKHRSELFYWESMWRNLSHCDDDLKVALKGAMDGKKYRGKVLPDVRQFHSVKFDKILNDLSLREKTGLPSNYWSPQEVANIVANYFPSSEYWAWRSMSRNNSKNQIEKRLNPWEKLNAIMKKRGIRKASLWAVGSVLARSGIALKNWSEN